MKKILSMVLVVLTIISLATAVVFNTYATDISDEILVNGNYSYTVSGSNATIVGYNGEAVNLTVVETIGKYQVTAIGYYAFMMNDNLLSVTLTKNIESIGDGTFAGCNNLSKVEILNPECVIFDSENTIPENAIIEGYDNSTAYEYALKYERNFNSLGEAPTEPSIQKPTEIPTQPELVLGDVDGDDKLSVMDATAIQLHMAQIKMIPDEIVMNGDTDEDGKLSVMDATQIQLFLAQIVPEI